MQSQNKYIGDDKFQKMLEHYQCPTPISIIKMRFAGAICSPNMDLRPADVISSLWPKEQEPRLQTKEEAELFFKFFMGLWDEIFNQIKLNQINIESFKKSDPLFLAELCQKRYNEIEQGYMEGFWGGKQDLEIPAYIAEIVDSLSDLAKLYLTLGIRAEQEKDLNNLTDTIKHTDKMVNRSIAFIIENMVLPKIDDLKQKTGEV